MHKKFVATVFTIFSFMLPSRANIAIFNLFFICGDSLFDSGDSLNTTSKFSSLEEIPIILKTPAYALKGLSNGNVWVNFVGKTLGLTPTPTTAVNKIPVNQGVNFVFGAASSG